MRVAVLHFHLRRGGVTRVIETAWRSLLERDVELLVLTGEEPAESTLPPDIVKVIPGLGYSDEFDIDKARSLKIKLEAAAREKWNALPDLWQIHNHSLAKNLKVPWVVSEWATEGQRLLLQLHDFAEDGRPANYRRLTPELRERLYPVGSKVLYGLLNSRDRQHLNTAGVPEAQTVPLPNAVGSLDLKDDPIGLDSLSADRLILYPTRAIRRKNLGELLLHSAAAERGTVFGCTLAPENPTAVPVYDQWTHFAMDQALPVEFNLGPRTGASLESMMLAAESIVTTSVAEGFGLAFLEPWLAQRPLVGRDLPDITDHFKAASLTLKHLYSELPIPLGWIAGDLRPKLRERLKNFNAAYEKPLVDDDFEKAFADWTRGRAIDFGRLDETWQEKVIARVKSDSNAADLIRSMQPLRTPGEEALSQNNQVARTKYGIVDYGVRLEGYYQKLLSAPDESCEWLDSDRLLTRFLDPQRFCLLRT